MSLQMIGFPKDAASALKASMTVWQPLVLSMRPAEKRR